jgi:tetratricopeptide (TPR) repeat protein
MNNRLKLALGAGLLIAVAAAGFFVYGAISAPSAADKQRSRALFAQAQTELEAGDQDAALGSLNQSIRLDEQNDALRVRSSILIARSEFDAALADLDKVISRRGGLAENYSTRCWLRARGDRLDAAVSDCNRAIELDPSLASGYGNRGLVRLKQGRNLEAWEDFNTALRVGGSDQWVAWRLFGRAVAAWGQGRAIDSRQDADTALRGNPAVAAEFAQFGLGQEMMGELEEGAYASATSPASIFTLQQFVYLYPNGARTAEARAQIAEFEAWIAQQEAAGRQALPGYSFAHARGPGAEDSFGAIAISRAGWRVAFSTDYASPDEAEQAAANACQSGAGRCDAYAFRNVCAALSLSPPDRTQGLAWSYSRDDALRTAIAGCQARGGRNCVAVHSQCTPTPDQAAATAAASQ